MVDASMNEPVAASQSTLEEPAAKRQKMTVSKIREFRYPHVDDVDVTMGTEFDFDVFPEFAEQDHSQDFEYQEGGDDVHFGTSPQDSLQDGNIGDDGMLKMKRGFGGLLRLMNLPWIQLFLQSWTSLRIVLK